MTESIFRLRSTKSCLVILLPCLLTGGTEVVSLETAKALHSLGYSVEVVVYFDEIDETMLASFRETGLQVHLLGVHRGTSFLSNWQLMVALWEVLWRRRFDVIWVQYMTPTLQPLLIARLFTRKLITAVHVAASHYSPAGLRRLRWIAKHMRIFMVCVSHTVANGILESERSEQRKRYRVRVLPNALDLSEVQLTRAFDWRTHKGWPADVVVLGFAGRLVHAKGVDLLLHAVALLHDKGLPVRLILVGEGEDGIKLQALSQQLGINAITSFVGRLPRAEIYSAIKGFDIAVMPSRSGLEGFGLSALEAMAAGVPVVASRVDALQEIVVDGATGLLCPTEDPVALADSMASLVINAELRKKMGSLGVAHVSQFYDTRAFRENLAQLMAVLDQQKQGYF